MRIGLSTTVMQEGRTGAGQYVMALLRALLQYAPHHDYVLLALERDVPLLQGVAPEAQIVPVPEVNRPPLKDFAWHQFTLPRLAEELRLDVLHVPSHRRMVWRRTCGLVTTIADAGPLRATQEPLTRDSSRSTLFRQLLQRQDAFITVTHGTADILVQLADVPPSRVSVIRNGIDGARFHPGAREESARHLGRRYGLNPPFFIYVGRLEAPGKNHARLIDAFNAFKTSTPSPWQLVLVGGEGRGSGAVHEAIQRSPYAQDIRWVGFVAPEELPDWYRAAGALLYPTIRAGFAQPVLEAMACGCPVLVSHSGPGRELTDGAAAMVDPHDTEALRRQLAQLAFDPALREQLRQAGFVRARQFSWSATAAATLAVYARAAERARPSPLAAPALISPYVDHS